MGAERPPPQWLVPLRPPPLVPPLVWCGSGFGSALSPCAPLWCGVVRGSGRPACFGSVVIIIVVLIIIIIIVVILILTVIIMMFLSWDNCHGKRARQERLLVTVACSIPAWQSPGWKVSTVTRIGCVWDEILVTVDGFGAPCGRSTHSHRDSACRGGYHGTQNRDHICSACAADRELLQGLLIFRE